MNYFQLKNLIKLKNIKKNLYILKLIKEIENIDELIKKISEGELLSIEEFNKVFSKAKEILEQRKNIAILKTPLIICGCINAHFEELKDIFITCGNISENKYLFLGDYVGMDYQHLFY